MHSVQRGKPVCGCAGTKVQPHRVCLLLASLKLEQIAELRGKETGAQQAPLDHEFGTHTSAAGAVLGIGLMAAAVNPAGNIAWVRAGILYGFVVLAFEAGSWLLWRAQFHLGPVIFGLAFSMLLIATYPERRRLIPSAIESSARTQPPLATETHTTTEAETETKGGMRQHEQLMSTKRSARAGAPLEESRTGFTCRPWPLLHRT